jgi:light-regulated signal transduction histidine kinase (bacteriophytochrome)
LLKAKVSVFVELYKKNHRLLAQEQKLIAINKNLEAEINERKNSEEKIVALNRELLENIDRLEDANKELDRVAFMASHDLQEPLRKIRIFTDRLFSKYKDLIDDEGRTYFRRIDHAAERMQVLIRDILTFSKISTNKEAFINSDLSLILHEVLLELDGMIREKKAVISAGYLPQLVVNPGLIRLLFLNLLTNALKYCRSGVNPAIKVHCESGGKASETSYFRIYIEDNGIGFDQRHAEQIFLMFKRLHGNSEYEGTGIGLALCKKIVEEHKGFISATSKVNEGSTFIISLPILPDHTEEKVLAGKVTSISSGMN